MLVKTATFKSLLYRAQRIRMQAQRRYVFPWRVKLGALKKRPVNQPIHRKIALPDFADKIERWMNAKFRAQ